MENFWQTLHIVIGLAFLLAYFWMYKGCYIL